MNVSMSEDSILKSSRSKFFCPGAPLIIWDLERKVFIQLGIALSATIGSFALLLNILVILTVKKTRELQTNSIILVTSLAVADLLVGAVSAPFNITLDALILRGTVSVGMICVIANVTRYVSNTAYRASYYHVVLFSWERFVAIVKPMKCKAIVISPLPLWCIFIPWFISQYENATEANSATSML